MESDENNAARPHGGLISRFWGWAGKRGAELVGTKTIKAYAGLITGLAKEVDPRRYPIAKASTWMTPPKNAESFGAAMVRMNLSRGNVEAVHKSHACTVYALVLLATCIVAWASTGILDGHQVFQRTATIACVLALFPAMAVRHSMAAMQIRRMDFNIGIREWLAFPMEWIPPLTADLPKIIPDRKRAKKRPS
jgi:hypothetical protein